MQAFAALPAALKLIEKTDLTTHHCLDGYPGVVEACLLQWQRATTPAAKSRLAAQYTRAIRALGRSALIFPLGRPALHLFRGRYELACGRQPAALRSFGESQKQATQLGMRHEAALAAAWHGKAVGGAAGQAATNAALEQLRKLGVTAVHELTTT